MGCDIHAHVEVKIYGEWEHLNAPQLSRDYAMFGKMAGVRSSSETPISEPKGLPEDMSFITRLEAERYGEDGHSHSWLSAEEMCQLSEWLTRRSKATKDYYFEKDFGYYFEKDFGYLFSNGWDVFTKYKEDKPIWLEDARLVFWFDN